MNHGGHIRRKKRPAPDFSVVPTTTIEEIEPLPSFQYRGEKLYVTKDKRRPTSWRRCLSWIVACTVISVVLIVAILAGTGVILSQEQNLVKEASIGRNFAGANLNPSVTQKSSVTPMPTGTKGLSSSPTTDMSYMYVPRSIESQLIIDNLDFDPALLDTNSSSYHQFAANMEDQLKMILFDKEALEFAASDVGLRVVNVSRDPFKVNYRIGWNYKQGVSNPPEPIKMEDVKRRLVESLARNQGYIGKFHIDGERIKVENVINICQMNNGGCSHICYYKYLTQLFTCTCPTHLVLDGTGLNCVEWTESSEQDFLPVPERDFEMHHQHDVHHHGGGIYEVEPTAEPAPEPTAEPTAADGTHGNVKHWSHSGAYEHSDTKDHEPSAEPTPEPTPDSEGHAGVSGSKEPAAEPTPGFDSTGKEHSWHQGNSHGSHSWEEPSAEPTPEPGSEGRHDSTGNEPTPEPNPKQEVDEHFHSTHGSHSGYFVPKEHEPSAEPTPEPTADGKEHEPAPEPTAEPSPESKDVSHEHHDHAGGSYSGIVTHSDSEEHEPSAEPTPEPSPDSTDEHHPSGPYFGATDSKEHEPSAEPTPEPSPDSKDEHHDHGSYSGVVTHSDSKEHEPSAEPTPEPSPDSKDEHHPSGPYFGATDSKEHEPSAEPTPEPSPDSKDEHHDHGSYSGVVSHSDSKEHEPSAEPTPEPSPDSKDEHNDHASGSYSGVVTHSDSKEHEPSVEPEPTPEPSPDSKDDHASGSYSGVVTHSDSKEHEPSAEPTPEPSPDSKDDHAGGSYSGVVTHSDSKEHEPSAEPTPEPSSDSKDDHHDHAGGSYSGIVTHSDSKEPSAEPEPTPEPSPDSKDHSDGSPSGVVDHSKEPSAEPQPSTEGEHQAEKSGVVVPSEHESSAESDSAATKPTIDHEHSESKDSQPTGETTISPEHSVPYLEQILINDSNTHQTEHPITGTSSEGKSHPEHHVPLQDILVKEPSPESTNQTSQVVLEDIITNKTSPNDAEHIETTAHGDDGTKSENTPTGIGHTTEHPTNGQTVEPDSSVENNTAQPKIIEYITLQRNRSSDQTTEQPSPKPENRPDEITTPQPESLTVPVSIFSGDFPTKEDENKTEQPGKTESSIAEPNQNISGADKASAKPDDVKTNYDTTTPEVKDPKNNEGIEITQKGETNETTKTPEELSNNIKDESPDNEEFNTLLDKDYKNKENFSGEGKESVKYTSKPSKGDKKKVKDYIKGEKIDGKGEGTIKPAVTPEDFYLQKHVNGNENAYDLDFGVQNNEHTTDGEVTHGVPGVSFQPHGISNHDIKVLQTVAPDFRTDVPGGWPQKTTTVDKEGESKLEKDYTKFDKDYKYEKQKGAKKKDLKKKVGGKDGKNVELDDGRKFYTEFGGKEYDTSYEIPDATQNPDAIDQNNRELGVKILPKVGTEETATENPEAVKQVKISTEGQSSTVKHEDNVAGVTDHEISAPGVVRHEINAGGVTEPKINVGGVTEQEISTPGVAGHEINTAGIARPETNADGVTEPKINTGGVTESKFTTSGVTEHEISAPGVARQEINADGVTEPKTTVAGVTGHEISTSGAAGHEIGTPGATGHEINAGGAAEPKITIGGVTESKFTSSGVTEHEMSGPGVVRQEINTAGVTQPKTTVAGVAEHEIGAPGVVRHEINAAGVTEYPGIRSEGGVGVTEYPGVNVQTHEGVFRSEISGESNPGFTRQSGGFTQVIRGEANSQPRNENGGNLVMTSVTSSGTSNSQPRNENGGNLVMTSVTSSDTANSQSRNGNGGNLVMTSVTSSGTANSQSRNGNDGNLVMTSVTSSGTANSQFSNENGGNLVATSVTSSGTVHDGTSRGTISHANGSEIPGTVFDGTSTHSVQGSTNTQTGNFQIFTRNFAPGVQISNSTTTGNNTTAHPTIIIHGQSGSLQDGHSIRFSNTTGGVMFNGTFLNPDGHSFTFTNYTTTFPNGSVVHPTIVVRGQSGALQDGHESRFGNLTFYKQITTPGVFTINGQSFNNSTVYRVENGTLPGTVFDGHFNPQDGHYHMYTNSSGSFVYTNASTQPTFVIKGNSGDFGNVTAYILGNRTNNFFTTFQKPFASNVTSSVGGVQEVTLQPHGSNESITFGHQMSPTFFSSETAYNVNNYFGYISKCAAGQFQCVNGTSKRGSACISLSSKCDSINDCSDGSDEHGCIENGCPGNFQCSDGTCLKRHLVCNGIVDCSDGSDEKKCESWKCEFDEFQCPSGRCIPVVWQCDNKPDCDNHTDEYRCQTSCGNDEYLCPEGWCIPLTYKCNGIKECSNGEDEQLCDCSHEEFRCQTGGCVSKNQVCNGLDDCPDRSDEWGCVKLETESNLLKIRTASGDYEPICADNWSAQHSDEVCASLGYFSSTPIENETNSSFTTEKSFYVLKNDTTEHLNKKLLVNLMRSNGTCSSGKLVEVACQEFSCGSRSMTDSSSVEARLVGGMSATTGQWPSVALLYNIRNFHSCTANVVTPRWVLASYNCLKMGNKNLNQQDWKMFGGSTVFEAEKENAETRNVVTIVPHPQVKFNQFLFSNDLALVELDQPLQFTTNVGAVCLPEQEIQPRQICVTAGWGMNTPEDKSIRQQLQYQPVPTMNLTECNSTEHYSGFITEDKICAGYNAAEKSLCYNEEGAPLMCVNDRGEWELQGVLSYHSNCGRGSHPSIFSSIIPVKNWIKQTIGNSFERKTTVVTKR